MPVPAYHMQDRWIKDRGMIYAYTGDTNPDIIKKCKHIGMNGALIKPLDINLLNKIMKTIEENIDNKKQNNIFNIWNLEQIFQNRCSSISFSLNGLIKKSKSTQELIGCDIEQLWIHLEKSFKSGMTRKNYGKWHVDHIIPCASFDLTKPEEQAKCFHYTNLQPLWASENLAKGSKIS